MANFTAGQFFTTLSIPSGSYIPQIRYDANGSNKFSVTLDTAETPASYLSVKKVKQAGDYKIIDIPSNMPFGQSGIRLVDFIKAHSSLKLTNNLVRLPGNNAWNTLNHKRTSALVKPVVLKLDSAGYNVMGWDIEWDFNKQGKPLESGEKMARIIDSSIARNRTLTKNHMVILMHDHMYRTASDSTKLATMIGLLKKNPNYEFRKISQYPGLKNSGH